jgi:hypothetical protein
MQNNSGPQANARQTCTETRKEEDHDHCRVIEQQRNDQSDGCAALAVMARQPASDSQGEQGAPATCCSPPPDHNPSTVIYDAVQCLDYQQLAELTDLYLPRPAPAAIAAAYAPRSASVTSCRLLRNAKVQAEVLVWKALTDVVAAAKPDTLLHWYRAGYLRLPQYFCLQKVLALAISTVHTPRNIPPKPKGISSPSTKIAQHEDRPEQFNLATESCVRDSCIFMEAAWMLNPKLDPDYCPRGPEQLNLLERENAELR